MSQADPEQISALMEEEVQAWKSELDWDYSPVRQILLTFLEENLLPGFVALNRGRLLGYTYFLVHRNKGLIGTVYASKPHCSQEAAEGMLELAVDSLKHSDRIRRIEAQIIPFNDLILTSAFTRQGFQYFHRYYLELDLASYECQQQQPCGSRVVPWDSAYLSLSADVLLQSYQDQIDALICEDYCSFEGCETYLHSLVQNPGCGIFLAPASYIGLDSQGLPSGFIITSLISPSAAMIPQISILPSSQGCGLGRALIQQSLLYLKTSGFRTVSLTVTKNNRRAFEWYQRVGFRIRKEFGAYVWQRA